MENKLNLPLKKKKNEAESPRLDPLMRALKALHSAGAPETMTEEELEHQRRSQEVPLPVFLMTFLVCILLNLLSAGIPAYRAAKMSIVDSLYQNDQRS